jgi:hypothetical protein
MSNSQPSISALAACHAALVLLDGCNWLDSDPFDIPDLAKGKEAARAALAQVAEANVAAHSDADQPVGRFEKAGDRRVNANGSVSELVDDGDGGIGTLTTGIPAPTHPVFFDPSAAVPIPHPDARRASAVRWEDMNRYERENAMEKIRGYLIPRNGEQPEKSFDRAKAECLGALRRQIATIEATAYKAAVTCA